MPSDTHKNLQIHQSIYSNELTLPRPLPLRSLPLLVAWGWVNFCLFTSGSHLCIWVYNMGSKLDSFLRKRCFFLCFVHVVLFIGLSLEIMQKNYISRFILQGRNIIFENILRVRCTVSFIRLAPGRRRVYTQMHKWLRAVNKEIHPPPSYKEG